MNEYANAVLAGDAYLPQSTGKPKIGSTQPKEDVSVVISKLNTGIDDVSKRIKTIVSIDTGRPLTRECLSSRFLHAIGIHTP